MPEVLSMEIMIYKITNSCNDKIYIGQTTQSLKKRLYNHVTKANSGMQRKFHKAIAELGKENFKIEQLIIATTKEAADKLETFFMKHFDAINNGYNTIDRAAGSFNRGADNGMAGKTGNSNPCSRPIIAVYYDDTITEWESMSLFCEANKECDVRNVQAVAAGKRAVANNFVIFYKEEFSEEKVKEKREKSLFQRRVTLLDKDKNLIKHFRTLEEASKETGVLKSTLSRRIKKGNKNEDGSYFVYDLKIFK